MRLAGHVARIYISLENLKRLLGRPKSRWDNDNKLYVGEKGWAGVC